jgi:hypothetical protein
VEQTVAAHRANSPKRHVFRREFEQSDSHLISSYANNVKRVSLDIYFLSIRPANRIDFSRFRIERSQGGLTES